MREIFKLRILNLLTQCLDNCKLIQSMKFVMLMNDNSKFINVIKVKERQCLLHRPGFQHLIAAAPVAAIIFFCCSIYYLSGWHRCPNPNSNNKILEKKKRVWSEIALCAIFKKHVLRVSIPQPSALLPSVPTTTPSGLRMHWVKVLYLNRINAKNAIRCTSDLMSEIGTVQ